MIPPYRDRHEAGQLLGQELSAYANRKDVLVVGLARGGVVVAYEVARQLHAPLDVLVVRKIGAPGQPELAMGAVAPDGTYVLNEEVVGALHVCEEDINSILEQEKRELKRRERVYRCHRPSLQVKGLTIIVVDDGLATGSTMRAAIAALRRRQPARLVVAVPVGASGTCREFGPLSDQVVCLRTPKSFCAIGLWYQDFSQTTDEEVCHLLDLAESGKNENPLTDHAA